MDNPWLARFSDNRRWSRRIMHERFEAASRRSAIAADRAESAPLR
jgi:hypothetical protein